MFNVSITIGGEAIRDSPFQLKVKGNSRDQKSAKKENEDHQVCFGHGKVTLIDTQD